MKKLFTLFALMCLMVSGAWAEIVPTVEGNLTSNPTVYVMTNGAGVTIANDLTIYTGAAPQGQFAFINVSDNKYKIYETTTDQYVALINAPVAIGQSVTRLNSNPGAAEIFEFELCSDGVSYLISPTSEKISRKTYLNFYGGAQANAGGSTIGFYKDGAQDIGSRWILSEGALTTEYYYIKDNEGSYLYNDHNSPQTTSWGTRTSSNPHIHNNFIWRISTDKAGNVTYIVNGEGKGYWEGGKEIKKLTADELANKPWNLEKVSLPEGWDWVEVHVRYAETGMLTCTGYSHTQYVGNGGFLAFDLRGASLTNVAIGHTDVEGYTGATDPAKRTKELVTSYYTQKEVDDVANLTEKIWWWYGHLGKVGYPEYDLIYDERYSYDMVELGTAALGYDLTPRQYVEPGSYYDLKNALAQMCAITEFIEPVVGKAYTLAVRKKDGSKLYLKDGGGLSENSSDAAIFVLGKSNDNDYEYVLATNAHKNGNTQSYYLRNNGASAEYYTGDACDLKFQSMVSINGSGFITADYIERVGTFTITAKKRYDGENRVGALIYSNSKQDWDKSDAAYMNDDYTSAIEMEEILYPYNKVTMTAGNDRVKYTGSFATIYLPFPMTMPEGVEVYEGTEEKLCHVTKGLDEAGQKVDLNKDITFLRLNCIKEAGIPANVPAGAYILYSQNPAEEDFLSLPAPEDVRSKVTNKNILVGSTEDPENYKRESDWKWNAEIEDFEEVPHPGDKTLWDNFLASHPTQDPYVLGNKSKTSVTDDYDETGIGFYMYKGETYPKGKAIFLKDKAAGAKSLKLDFGGIVTAIEALHGNTTSTEIYDLQGRRLDKVQKGQINVINGQKVMFN